MPAKGSQTALPGDERAWEAMRSEMEDSIEVLPMCARDLSEYLWMRAEEGEWAICEGVRDEGEGEGGSEWERTEGGEGGRTSEPNQHATVGGGGSAGSGSLPVSRRGSVGRVSMRGGQRRERGREERRGRTLGEQVELELGPLDVDLAFEVEVVELSELATAGRGGRRERGTVSALRKTKSAGGRSRRPFRAQDEERGREREEPTGSQRSQSPSCRQPTAILCPRACPLRRPVRRRPPMSARARARGRTRGGR